MFHEFSVECDDPDFIRVLNSNFDFANSFHQADECGKFEAIKEVLGTAQK
jgi:hypothetical protein